MLPDLPHTTISPEALAYYQSAFPTIASRRSVRRWPEELPLDGFPADNAGVVDSYHGWLAETDVPKLLLRGDKGISIKKADVNRCRENLSNLDIVDLGTGTHFLQETHP